MTNGFESLLGPYLFLSLFSKFCDELPYRWSLEYALMEVEVGSDVSFPTSSSFVLCHGELAPPSRDLCMPWMSTPLVSP